jgi:hypothetical protein
MTDTASAVPATGEGARRSSVAAASIAVGTGLVLVTAAVLDVASRDATVPALVGPWQGRLVTTFSGAVVASVGWILVVRVPGNRYGWVWLWIGAAHALLTLAAAYTVLGTYGGAPLPFPAHAALVGDHLWLATVALAPLLLLWFPDGQLPSPRWRWTHRTLVVGVVVAASMAWLRDGTLGIAPIANPLGRPGAWSATSELVVGAGVVAIFACFLAGIGSLIVRYRSGDTQRRLQVRWLAAAAVPFSLTFWIDPPGIWDHLFEAAAFASLPAAVTVAVLRYRLYELDRLLSRTLTYAVVAVVLFAVYVASVVTLGTALRGLTGGASDDVVVAAGTLLAAAVFHPARRRVGEALDRRFDRARYDAHRTVERFGQRLRDEVDVDALRDDLLALAGTTVRPSTASVWLRAPDPS